MGENWVVVNLILAINYVPKTYIHNSDIINETFESYYIENKRKITI